MHFAWVILLSLAFTLSYATDAQDRDDGEREFVAMDESELQLSRKGCVELGGKCDSRKNDCQCCESYAICQCSWIDWSWCTCQTHDASTNFGACQKKKRDCDPGLLCGKQPCTNKACSHRSG